MVMVLMLVGALTGPTLLLGASGFFWIKDVWFARPLYVPSGWESFATVRVDPRRLFADNASFEPSSYQLLCLVASLTLVMRMLRSAAWTVADRSLLPVTLFFDEAVTVAIFLRRLMRCPASSSEDEKSLSSLSAGGGVAGRLRRFAFPFAPLFLKRATGAAGPSFESAIVRDVCGVGLSTRQEASTAL